MFAEGRSHREAADLVEQEESCEEVASLFAALPFSCMESESEEGGSSQGCSSAPESGRDEGVVVELSQIGPNVRRLKPPIMTIGEQTRGCGLDGIGTAESLTLNSFSFQVMITKLLKLTG